MKILKNLEFVVKCVLAVCTCVGRTKGQIQELARGGAQTNSDSPLKRESTKHKRVVDELKQRKANGETNLIIRNGIISQRQPRVNIIAETTNTQQATNCS